MKRLKVIITKYPLLSVLLGAFLLRLIGLNQSLWLDESTTARVVQQYNFGQILTQFSPNDFHPPLYYLFMKLWTNIYGYSEIAMRMPSVIATLLTGLVVYETVNKACLPAGRSIKSVKSAAIWATAFFLFNPLIVYYSQEARMYAFATLFVTLIFWSVANVSKVHKVHKVIKSLIFANVCIALALGIYYGSVFFILALYGYLLLKREFKLTAYLLPGSLIAGAMLYPLFITQLKNSGEVLQTIPNWSATLGKANLKNLFLIPIKLTSGRISFEPKWLYYAISGVWVGFIGYLLTTLALKSKKYNQYFFLIKFPIFLGFVISFYKPLLQYFRFIYVIPFLAILLAVAARMRWQRVTLLTGFVVFSLIYTYIPNFHREDWKSLTASIQSNQVCALPSSFDPLHYYKPKLVTIDIRTCETGAAEIVTVPYAEDIYGFSHKEYMTKRNYTLSKEVSFRGLKYEVWKQ